jgi:hypothetical protein
MTISRGELIEKLAKQAYGKINSIEWEQSADFVQHKWLEYVQLVIEQLPSLGLSIGEVKPVVWPIEYWIFPDPGRDKLEKANPNLCQFIKID